MTEIKRLVFNSFQVNTYIVYDETKECVIIDPACEDEAEFQQLKNFIDSNDLTPVKHLNTHAHIDHIVGIPLIKKTWSLRSYMHDQEIAILDNAVLMAELFNFSLNEVPHIEDRLQHNDEIRFGNSSLTTLHVPGHSPGSLSFFSGEGKFVISGDALFEGSIGRTDLPGGDYDMLIESITNQLLTLPQDTVVYPGHGNHSTIGEEKKYNPFLNASKT